MPYTDPALQRASQLASLQRKRQRCIQHLGGRCVVCGSADALEFHHRVRQDKAVGIGQVLSRRWEVILPELAKCELRCEAHHKEAHAPVHGTVLYFDGCRCDVCRAAYSAYHNDYQRAYRARKKAEDPFYRRKRPSSP